MRDEAQSVARAAREATERAAEMARLVAFGHALARSMDSESSDSIGDVAAGQVPLLAPGRGAWVMTRTRGGHWESMMAVGESSPDDRERAARRALGEVEPLIGVVSSDICFPMIVAGTPEGVLGVAPEPPLTEHQRNILSAAAALLAVSLKNSQLFREVRENSVRDALTGCFNRAHAVEVLDAEIRRARRSKLPLSLIMFDLDNFKEINDRHGHLCGDAVLAAVGSRMKSELRGSDMKCRYGGDEFMLILPDTPLAGAKQVSENLRTALESHHITWNADQVRVTASFGVAVVNPTDLDPLAAIARADSALYRAKERGRNDVVAEEQPTLV
jgi:diguanylate cyclase (GGDEF)-like protein